MSGLGKPDDLSLDIIKRCEEILKEPGLPEILSDFYASIIKFADQENKKKLERDEIELSEEEF